MNSEQWKTIPNFPEYEVSDRGRVRRGVSLRRLDGTRVRLSQNGEQAHVNVTALVYSLFPERKEAALGANGERWKPIPKWESMYEVSDQYRVRRLGRLSADGSRIINPLLLSLSRNNGYLVAYLVGKRGHRQATKFYVEAAVENLFPAVAPPRFDEMNEPGEIWKEIAGYEGLYEVSNLGRVRSVGWYVNGGAKRRYARPSLRKTSVNVGTGYPKVELTVKGKTKSHMIHRLVASAFIPNPLNLPIVHHKDENKLNARSDNLEWTTNEGNIRNWFDARSRRVDARLIEQIIAAGTSGKTPSEILAALTKRREAERTS